MISPIVCPFCPLHCDDVDPDRLRQSKTGCQIADRRMKAVARLPEGSGAADIETCRRWVADASRIVITGEVIDLETSRAISEFIDACGADVNVTATNPTSAEVFAREGAILATCGELRRRDVSVWVIGDPAAHWPRIAERLQRIKALVRWPDDHSLPDRLANLRCELFARAESPVQADKELTETLRVVKAASYLVVLIGPLEESAGRSPVVWSSIYGLVRELNQVSRAAILTFDPSLTLRNVLAMSHAPSAARFPADDTALHVEFSPFGEASTRATGRSIVIGSPPSQVTDHQQWLPASVPGIHHDAIVIRGDGSVTLPLQGWLAATAVRGWSTPAAQLRRLFV